MFRILHALAVGALLGLAGCSGNSAPPDPASSATPLPANPTGEHGHKPGQHGGVIVQIGADNYHAEPVFEKGGLLRLHMLARDESKVLEVEAQPVTAYVKAPEDAEAEAVVLRPDPLPDDTKGKTSRFVAQLPRGLIGKRVQVTIPSIRIGEERFRVSFASAQDGDEHGMPAKVGDEDERRLYLTAGGKYTAEDIKANGNRTASEAFKGVKAEHDLKPKAGDPICPITLTKANPSFSWVVGGKKYEFCCPPCVDEFVALAKEKPDEVKEPEFYRKK
jgi:YHS domain-containing protein